MKFGWIPTWLQEFEKEAGYTMKKVTARLKVKVIIVCPCCGEVIEVSLEGLSNYDGNET